MPNTLASTETDTDKLIVLIAGALTLSDDEKDAYLQEIEAGAMPATLQGAAFQAFCDAEQVAVQEEIAALDDAMAVTGAVQASETEHAGFEAHEILTEQEKGTAEDVAAFGQACATLERGVATEVEGNVRKDEAGEADRIRAMLKQEPTQ